MSATEAVVIAAQDDDIFVAWRPIASDHYDPPVVAEFEVRVTGELNPLMSVSLTERQMRVMRSSLMNVLDQIDRYNEPQLGPTPETLRHRKERS